MKNFGNIANIKGWFNSVKQTVIIYMGRSAIVPLNKFVKDYEEKVSFMRCEKLTNTIEILRNSTDDVQLVALGGMGKTRLLYEAFKENVPENAYFCYNSQGDSFNKDLEQFLQDERHKEGLIVLDNCPNDSIQYCISQRTNHGSNIRMIFVHHDYFERKNFPDTIMVEVVSKETKEMVDNYIEQRIYHTEQNRFICERIKEMSDGYPQMAILLANAYEKKGKIGVDDVEILMEVLIGKQNDDQMKVLKCLSLFQPLGYRAPVKEQFDAVIGNSILTGMYGSEGERRDTFDRWINHFNGEIVETSSSWLNVRPLPLAIWLMGKWLNEHGDERLMQLISDFDQWPQRLASQLGNQMYRRLRNMAGNDRAQLLIGELCERYSSSPFGAEGVVCSDLGSRLFLAFAYVNHLATAQCIHGVVSGKSIDSLRDGLSGNVRRNIVWALEKLCYPEDSFTLAATDLLKLAVAENEDIGNNATGQLTQLFHILLPGTSANLQTRADFLRKAAEMGVEYKDAVLKCLDSALAGGSFTKMGGAEEFGTTKYEDYIPTEGEVTEYWKTCASLLVDMLRKYPNTLPEVKHITEGRSYQLMHKGRAGVVDILAEAIYAREIGEWMTMYSHFYDVKKSWYAAYSPEDKAVVDKWLDWLKPQTFSSLLKEVRMKVFNGEHRNYRDEYDYAQTLLVPLSQKFVETGIYQQQEEIRALMTENEYFDFGFSKMVSEKLNDEQLEKMLERMKAVVEEEGTQMHSPFFYTFCQNLKGRKPFEAFLNKMRDGSHEIIYVHLLANIEDEELTTLHRLIEETRGDAIGTGAIAAYLNRVSWMKPDMMLTVLRNENVKKWTTVSERMRFLERFQFDNRVIENEELLKEIRGILLSYEYDEQAPSYNRDYTNYVIRLLEKKKDTDFVKAICHKMIELMKHTYTHSNFEHIFYTLLNEYMEDVWEEFSEKFVDEEYSGFFYQVKDEVGSGFDFGRGVMYQHGDERIKELCARHPGRAPYCVGNTCPVFAYVENENGDVVRSGHFSAIMLWLLENYGKQDNTLDGAGGNIGSFAWTGSPIELYRDLVSCFAEVRESPKMDSKVKKWAQAHIEHFETQIRQEQGRIDFERMHYQ